VRNGGKGIAILHTLQLSHAATTIAWAEKREKRNQVKSIKLPAREGGTERGGRKQRGFSKKVGKSWLVNGEKKKRHSG